MLTSSLTTPDRTSTRSDVTTTLGTAKVAASVFGAGALACVACCALPLVLTVVGSVSAGAISSALSAVAQPYVIGAGAALGALGIVAWRRRRAARPNAACGETSARASCTVDGTCGCATAAPSQGSVPACTLAESDVGSRVDLYRMLFAQGVSFERPDARTLYLRFPSDASLEARARDLADREARCCTFLRSQVRRDDTALTWELRVPEGAEPVLDVFQELPGRLARGMTEAEARALLDRMNRSIRG